MNLSFSFSIIRDFTRVIDTAIRMAGVLAIVLASWGMPQTAAANAGLPVNPWDSLRNDDLRVAQVAYRLSLANSAQCAGETVAQPGFVVHTLAQYGAANRAAAARNFHLGALAGVLAVVPGSPAARAGLMADDQLVSVNDRELRPMATMPATATDAPSNDQVIAVRRILADALAEGPVVLRVTGPGGDRLLHFSAAAGCAARIELAPGANVNAWADGRTVVIGAGLLRRCANDDDLALVIAHEMAHNLLHHAERLALAHAAKSGLLQSAGSGSALMRQTEEEADRLGARLAITAGYDLGGAVAFLGGLMTGAGMERADGTHPATARRLALLSSAIAATPVAAPH